MRTKDDGVLQAAVKEYLANHGMKQQHFARLINQSPQMFSFWMRQKVLFKKEIIEQIKQIIFRDD